MAAGAGPSNDVVRLRMDLWAARDAAIGAEAAAGTLRARVKQLEADLDDRERHIQALLDRLAAVERRLAAIVEQRDAILASETWRVGSIVVRPWGALRRSVGRRSTL